MEQNTTIASVAGPELGTNHGQIAQPGHLPKLMEDDKAPNVC